MQRWIKSILTGTAMLVLLVSLQGLTAAPLDARDLLTSTTDAFDEPRDLAVEDRSGLATGLVAVADAGDHQVVVLDGSSFSTLLRFGAEGTGDGEFSQPSGVAFTSQRVLVVADTGNHRLQAFGGIDNLQANFLFEFGSRGSTPGQFMDPEGLGIDSADRIYVADTGNSRVQVFDSGGSGQGIIGSAGEGDGEFRMPADVEVCADFGPAAYRGRIYVVDRELDRVQIFEPLSQGADFVASFGQSGSDPGELDAPSGISLDHQCNLYIADSGNQRIQMFDPEGSFLGFFGTSPFRPMGVVAESNIGASSGISVADQVARSIEKYEWIDYDTYNAGDGLIDTDGDALPDLWETEGIDFDGDGVIDLDLPAMGASAGRKDIFVEVDYMTQHEFDAMGEKEVEDAFAAAPVDNPDGSRGISLHILVDEEIPHQNTTQLWFEFGALKLKFFGTATERNAPRAAFVLAAKRLVFHYSVFIHTICENIDVDFQACSGTSPASGRAELSGNDFVVSLSHSTSSARKASTFMHELGHNLGLLHGGGDEINCKPNYLSVMSYTFQMPRIPLGPAPGAPSRLDYSRSVLPPLDEAALDENLGIRDGTDWTVWSTSASAFAQAGQGNGPLDWNGKNGIEANVATDLNNFGTRECGRDANGNPSIDTQEVLVGWNDWASLDFDFRRDSDFYFGSHDLEEQPSEITPEEARVFEDAFERLFDLPDCNSNGIDDALDLADGTSLDIDASGVPDECEIFTVSCPILGTATGGTVSVMIEGFFDTCTVMLSTTPGQSAEAVLADLAAAINADPCLMSQDITATFSDNHLRISGFTLSFEEIAVTSTDAGLLLPTPVTKVPSLSFLGLLVLAISLLAVGLRFLAAGR